MPSTKVDLASTKTSKDRNLVMDALRGLASIYVVLFHFNEVIPYKPNFWQMFCKQGWLGVPVFFVISGWCMAMITQKERSPLVFITKRFMRIYAPYWLSLAVVLLTVAIRYLATGTNDVTALPKSAVGMFATLALLTKPATLVPPINWVYWSLTYEVAFYVLVAIGLFCRKPVFFLAMLLPLSYLKVSYQPSSFLGPLLFFADQYPLFALGFFAQGFKRTAFSLGLTALTAALCIYCTSWLMATVGGLTVVLLAWCWPGIKDLVWLRPLARVGDWSYGLYLIHVPIGCYLLIRYRSDFILTSTPLHISYDVAALGICIGASWLVHVTVEVPSQRLGQRLAANLKAGLARPA